MNEKQILNCVKSLRYQNLLLWYNLTYYDYYDNYLSLLYYRLQGDMHFISKFLFHIIDSFLYRNVSGLVVLL